MLNSLAAHGWLCRSADYRLRGGGQHPHPLVDTKRLIAWVRASAAELGADPSQVFLAGCSAGGHLAVSAALTPNAAELQQSGRLRRAAAHPAQLRPLLLRSLPDGRSCRRGIPALGAATHHGHTRRRDTETLTPTTSMNSVGGGSPLP